MYLEMRNLIRRIDDGYQQAQQLKDDDNYQQIRKNLKPKVYGGKFYFFGSRKMGVGTSESDVDLFICKNNSYYKGMRRSSIRFFINLLERRLRWDQNWKVKFVVRKWHVSFIRAYFKPDNIWVDITFDNGFAHKNTEILEHLFDIQPEAAKLCLLVKEWFQMYEVEMKGYQTCLLVIFFLQQKGLLPSIVDVQKGLTESFIGGYEVQYDPNRNLDFYKIERMKRKMMVPLVVLFFEFYRDFDYNLMISPKFGYSVKRFPCGWKKSLIELSGPLAERPHLLMFGRRKFEMFLTVMKESYDGLRN